MSRTISFGWGVPSFTSQLPELTEDNHDFADRMNNSITFLALHGIITESERDKAIKRATKAIEVMLSKVVKNEPEV